MRMIRLMRTRELEREERLLWKAGVWALNTPPSRIAMLRMAEIGNLNHGQGTHWIEETVTDGLYSHNSGSQ